MLAQKEYLQFSHLTLGSWGHFSVPKLVAKKIRTPAKGRKLIISIYM